MNLDEKDDFGLTLMGEDEIKAHERELNNTLDALKKTMNNSSDKVKRLLAVINPFLEKLSGNPDKTHVKWETRSQVVKELQDKIAEIVKS